MDPKGFKYESGWVILVTGFLTLLPFWISRDSNSAHFQQYYKARKWILHVSVSGITDGQL